MIVLKECLYSPVALLSACPSLPLLNFFTPKSLLGFSFLFFSPEDLYIHKSSSLCVSVCIDRVNFLFLYPFIGFFFPARAMSLRPNARTEVRRNRYKVAVDAEEGRRRREDNLVEIRKNKREENLMKKRREGMQAFPDFPPSSTDPHAAVDKKVNSGGFAMIR